MKRRVVIGVDGGGTKTLALASDIEGQWQGRGVSGPSNPQAVGFDTACAEIEYAILAALDGHDLVALCLGMAGAGRPEDVNYFIDWAQVEFPGAALRVVSDAEILLAAGTPMGRALALICGTGSIVFGRTATGELIRAGGWGYLFGDEGSGFAIGIAALRTVMQAYDGRGVETSLTSLVLTHRGLKDPTELVRNIYGSESPRTEIAGLAELVEQAAAQGDVIALSILDDAAAELAQMIKVVYYKLGNKPVPLALTGGAILHGAYLNKAFERECAKLGLVFSNVESVFEPAKGALAIARGMLLK